MDEKKKRTKCATSTRHTVILNELNPKEKVIFDFLQTQFNKSDTIKDILYEYIVTNNLQVNNQPITTNCIVTNNAVSTNNVVNDKYIASNNIDNDKQVIINCVENNKRSISKDVSSDNTKMFKMKFDESDDEVITVNNENDDSPEDKALKSLKNLWG